MPYTYIYIHPRLRQSNNNNNSSSSQGYDDDDVGFPNYLAAIIIRNRPNAKRGTYAVPGCDISRPYSDNGSRIDSVKRRRAPSGCSTTQYAGRGGVAVGGEMGSSAHLKKKKTRAAPYTCAIPPSSASLDLQRENLEVAAVSSSPRGFFFKDKQPASYYDQGPNRWPGPKGGGAVISSSRGGGAGHVKITV